MAYQVVIIGGGPGGYVAAIRAAQLGLKTALVEKREMGGTCLNRGCIPTKAMVAGVEKLRAVRHGAEFGLKVAEVSFDFARLMARKKEVVERLRGGVSYLLQKNGVEVIAGTGRIAAPGKVVVEKDGERTELLTENIIVATGSEALRPEALGYDGERVITSDEALEMTELPASIIILGGGVVGCEFACLLAELGCKVTVVEAMNTILPMTDKEVARQMQALLKKRGIAVKTKSKIVRVEKDSSGVKAVLENGEEITAEKMLISIGRVLNTSGLGLEEVGVQLGSRGEVIVDEFMRTSVPGIYAVGDITGKLQLAHVASAQGIVAVEHIAGRERAMNYTAVPACIFTSPEVAGVGMTTQEAEEKGIAVKTGKFPFLALGKAVAMGETEGFIKFVADAETDRILGVHIVGPHASDLIAAATVAVQQKMTVAEYTRVIHAHPTLAEGLLEAAEAVHGLSIHV